MDLNAQQWIMLDMAVRLGGGALFMPRSDGGPESHYNAALLDLEMQGLVSPPTAETRMAALKYSVSQAGREFLAGKKDPSGATGAATSMDEIEAWFQRSRSAPAPKQIRSRAADDADEADEAE